MLKTITVTWTDHYKPAAVLVALWVAEGGDSELNQALAYAATETRRTGSPVRVHTFATDETQWRDLSAAAHAAGRGL